MKRVVSFDAQGYECVPWSVPDIGTGRSNSGRKFRFAKKDKRLSEWQEYVAFCAGKAMTNKALLAGPIHLCLIFYKKTPPGRRHGEPWAVDVEWNDDKQKWVKLGKSSPDLLNLFKGTEDALESVIYANDVQTCSLQSMRLYGPLDGVSVIVWAIEPGDFPGRGEPVKAPNDDPPRKVPKPVRVRRRSAVPAGRDEGTAGVTRRADQVGVAAPGQADAGVPANAPAEGAGELRRRRRAQ